MHILFNSPAPPYQQQPPYYQPPQHPPMMVPPIMPVVQSSQQSSTANWIEGQSNFIVMKKWNWGYLGFEFHKVIWSKSCWVNGLWANCTSFLANVLSYNSWTIAKIWCWIFRWCPASSLWNYCHYEQQIMLWVYTMQFKMLLWILNSL